MGKFSLLAGQDLSALKARIREIRTEFSKFETVDLSNAIRIRTPRGFGQTSNIGVQGLLNNAPATRNMSSFGGYSLYNATGAIRQAIPSSFGQTSSVGAQNILNSLPKPTLLQTLSREFRTVTQAAQEFANTDLGSMTGALNSTAHAMQNLTLISGVLGGFGIREAQNLQRQNALLSVFSRTQERRIENEQQIRNYAEATHQSYLASLEAANAILPTVNRYRVDLEQVLSITQRLAILDPAQGTQGAAFAIREALSGQGRSLAARFELSLILS